MKRILQTVLLLLVFAGVAVGLYQKLQTSQTPSAEMTAHVESQSDQISNAEVAPLTVTYFTSDVRCVSCRKIEALTLATLEEQFAHEIDTGVVVFETHNIDESENKHFVEEYQLSFKTVVISNIPNLEGNASWKKMDKVWDYLNEPEAFKTYLADAIRDSLPEIS